MSVPVVAFFNNKGGVGKTTLVYHLSWMMAEMGVPVVAADLDPQANLTSAFLGEDDLENLYPSGQPNRTVFGALQPLIEGSGDVANPEILPIAERLNLLPGDLTLSTFEDDLSLQWPQAMSRHQRAFRVIAAFWTVIQKAASASCSEIALVDLGPSLGAANRAALVGSDAVVVPLSPDLYSLQGLRNLGPRLRQWRSEWQERLDKQPAGLPPMPTGAMQPIGYVLQQHSVRLDRPVRAYEKWIGRVPSAYQEHVLGGQPAFAEPCLAQLKHYRSLMPMAQEARRPIFLLRAADGAIGAHYQAVQDVARDFKALAGRILQRACVKTSAG